MEKERSASSVGGTTSRGRRRRRAALAIGALVLLYLFIGGSDGFYVQWRLRREIAALEQDTLRLKRENELARRQITRLERDMGYVERIARERYGMAHPGERVYRVLPQRERERDNE